MYRVKRRITWMSYMLFVFIGCAFISQGVLIIPVAETYGISIAIVGYLFFIPIAIQAIMTYFYGYFLDKVNLKRHILIALFSILISFVLITITKHILLFVIGLFFLGIAYGILTSIPNYLIISVNREKKFSKLNMLNFFFSLGGILGPMICGQMLGLNIAWQVILAVGAVYIILMLIFVKLTPFSKIGTPKVKELSEEMRAGRKRKWHLSIYLICIAMLFYVLSECIFSTWAVSYMHMDRSFSMEDSSMALTVFWIFITFGRFASDRVGRNMKIYKFILGSSLVAFLPYCFLFSASNLIVIYILIGIMGTGYAGLYAAFLSYGTDQLPYSSPQLMSLLVLGGTVGVVLAIPVSSVFVNLFGVVEALYLGISILLVLILLTIITIFDKKNPVSHRAKVAE